MYLQKHILPEDISITNEEIQKQIIEYGNREWRSYKEFKEYLDNNYTSNETKVIGWISWETRKKWFNEEDKHKENLWILTKGKNYWFVKTFSNF